MYPPILTRGKRVEIAEVDNTRERQTRQGTRINRQRQRQRQSEVNKQIRMYGKRTRTKTKTKTKTDKRKTKTENKLRSRLIFSVQTRTLHAIRNMYFVTILPSSN